MNIKEMDTLFGLFAAIKISIHILGYARDIIKEPQLHTPRTTITVLIWHVAPKKIFCFFVLSRAFSPS